MNVTNQNQHKMAQHHFGDLGTGSELFSCFVAFVWSYRSEPRSWMCSLPSGASDSRWPASAMFNMAVILESWIIQKINSTKIDQSVNMWYWQSMASNPLSIPETRGSICDPIVKEGKERKKPTFFSKQRWGFPISQSQMLGGKDWVFRAQCATWTFPSKTLW